MLYKEAEAAIYYLFMSADGNMTYNEEKRFNQICNDISLEDQSKEEVIKKCKELLEYSEDVKDIIYEENLADDAMSLYHSFDRSKEELARIIWNLINIGYADKSYSLPERRIVESLCRKWNIPVSVYQEFVDIADTMLSLVKQKDWIMKYIMDEKERDRKERCIDADIAQLEKEIKLALSELGM